MSETKPKQKTLLRENINNQNVFLLAKRIQENFKAFEVLKFIEISTKDLKENSLSGRIESVKKALHLCLPDSPEESIRILINSLPPALSQPNIDGLDLGSLNGMIIFPQCDYVVEKGQGNFVLMMNALKEMSTRFSAEGAIRILIENELSKCLEYFSHWVIDDNVHVRRLVSEGMRPRLPMFKHLKQLKTDPSPIIPILEQLKDDPELYVRRSVANNLNDISKDNPDVVVKLLARWSKEEVSEERLALVRHALRTLIKQGSIEALGILGYNQSQYLMLSKYSLNSKCIRLGYDLEIMIELINSHESQRVLVDYSIYFKKANGQLQAKVFKWGRYYLKKGESLVLGKKHKFLKQNSRKHYGGTHFIAVQINGRELGKKEFELLL